MNSILLGLTIPAFTIKILYQIHELERNHSETITTCNNGNEMEKQKKVGLINY